MYSYDRHVTCNFVLRNECCPMVLFMIHVHWGMHAVQHIGVTYCSCPWDSIVISANLHYHQSMHCLQNATKTAHACAERFCRSLSHSLLMLCYFSRRKLLTTNSLLAWFLQSRCLNLQCEFPFRIGPILIGDPSHSSKCIYRHSASWAIDYFMLLNITSKLYSEGFIVAYILSDILVNVYAHGRL